MIFIITFIIIILIYIYYKNTKYNGIKILIGTPIIDRDHTKIDTLLNSINHLLNNRNMYCKLMLVTRISDKNVIRKIKSHQKSNIILKIIDHYPIVKHHNMKKIAYKRQLIIDYAKNNNFNYVFFIDSDIVINKNTLKLLLDANADVCYCPSVLRWHNLPIIGLKDNKGEYIADATEFKHKKYIDIIGGGMGCTLIKNTTFDIKFKVLKCEIFHRKENKKYTVIGEDIGFFDECRKNKKIMRALLNHKIRHTCKRDTCIIL